MLKFIFSCVLSCSLLLMSPVSALAADEQCYPNEALKTLDKENAGGGTGTLFGRFSFTRDQALPDQAIKEIGWMTLNPGASIGLHKHALNEDTYIIISGEGIFTDSEGNETRVKAGDITIARAGQSHALRNEGKEPLCFIDVIAQNDGTR